MANSGEERKAFFSEEKKQKTFTFLAGLQIRPQPRQSRPTRLKSPLPPNRG
jgi:hypothetical protein